MYNIRSKMLPKNVDPLFNAFCLTKNHKINRQLMEDYITQGMDINTKFKDGKNILYALDFENMKHAIDLGADINNLDNQEKNLFACLLWDRSSCGAHTSYADYKKYDKINFVYENINDPFSFLNHSNSNPDLYTPFSLLSLNNIQHMKKNYKNEYNVFIDIIHKDNQHHKIFNTSILWHDQRYTFFCQEGLSPYCISPDVWREHFLGGYHTTEDLKHFFDNMPTDFIKKHQSNHEKGIANLPNRLRCTKDFSHEHFKECYENVLNMLYIIKEYIPVTRDKLMLGNEADKLFSDFTKFCIKCEQKELHDITLLNGKQHSFIPRI